ncbi:trypsin-1-like [Phlebotomus argentipes]|uniref:trypsin-1-like n=1 Tax=Phlebotomus argentipes TaxID=94469 RepID=UPI0028931D71|nr:trypsin-1-like [Phlebotomus argentipes]
MMRFVVLSVLIVGAFGANLKNYPKLRLDGKIVGGYEVNVEEAPYQASLQTDYSSCGASIISENFALTAAHCTDDAIADMFTLRVGSSYHAKGGKVVNVKRIVQHPQWNPQTIDYDFALLELAETLTFSEACQPVDLPEQDQDVEDGALLLVSGWGNTQNAEESREKLRAALVPKTNDEVCSEAYGGNGMITPRMICAGYEEGGKDACQGDSGGPLVENGTLVGVVSWGEGCAEKGYPGVYSRVASVRDWLHKEANL